MAITRQDLVAYEWELCEFGISSCKHDKFGPAVSGSNSDCNKAQINVSSDCRV